MFDFLTKFHLFIYEIVLNSIRIKNFQLKQNDIIRFKNFKH